MAVEKVKNQKMLFLKLHEGLENIKKNLIKDFFSNNLKKILKMNRVLGREEKLRP
jgi:hypothetical protein